MGTTQPQLHLIKLHIGTVRYLRKTRKERLDRLLAEIEWANASLEAAEGKRREEIALKAKALISYLKSERGEYVPSYDEI